MLGGCGYPAFAGTISRDSFEVLSHFRAGARSDQYLALALDSVA
jgi:hypothetical protein